MASIAPFFLPDLVYFLPSLFGHPAVVLNFKPLAPFYPSPTSQVPSILHIFYLLHIQEHD
jgi:hypothetical protein